MQNNLSEMTPYGITKVQALMVPDDLVSNRKVCVVDTGYNRGHPDLPNGNQVTGYTGTYTAGNWYEDLDGHGTHCAGTIAAIGGNEKGVVGVVRSGAMKIHIVKVFGDDGKWAWTSSLINAVSCSKCIFFLPLQEFCRSLMRNDFLTVYILLNEFFQGRRMRSSRSKCGEHVSWWRRRK